MPGFGLESQDMAKICQGSLDMSLGPRPECCYNGKFAETFFLTKQMIRKSTNKNIGLQISLFDLSLQTNKQAEVNPG